MSHIIGKVYDINKENMNKLILELDTVQAENEMLKRRLEFLQMNLGTSCASWSNKMLAASKEIK